MFSRDPQARRPLRRRSGAPPEEILSASCSSIRSEDRPFSINHIIDVLQITCYPQFVQCSVQLYSVVLASRDQSLAARPRRAPDEPLTVGAVLNAELKRYCCAIVPRIGAERTDPDLPEGGSGTCVLIGGRYFIATAGHVIKKHAPENYFITTPREESDLVLNVVGGNWVDDDARGDVGWLELDAVSAKISTRDFLPLQRIRTHCTGGRLRLSRNELRALHCL